MTATRYVQEGRTTRVSKAGPGDSSVVIWVALKVVDLGCELLAGRCCVTAEIRQQERLGLLRPAFRFPHFGAVADHLEDRSVQLGLFELVEAPPGARPYRIPSLQLMKSQVGPQDLANWIDVGIVVLSEPVTDITPGSCRLPRQLAK